MKRLGGIGRTIGQALCLHQGGTRTISWVDNLWYFAPKYWKMINWEGSLKSLSGLMFPRKLRDISHFHHQLIHNGALHTGTESRFTGSGSLIWIQCGLAWAPHGTKSTRIASLDWISRTVPEHCQAAQHAPQIRASDPDWGHVEAKWFPGSPIRIRFRSKILCGEPQCRILWRGVLKFVDIREGGYLAVGLKKTLRERWPNANMDIKSQTLRVCDQINLFVK